MEAPVNERGIAVVTLTCWECDQPWTHPRRQGQYPLRCPACTSSELGARIVARRAREQGLHTARAIHHEQQGWVCVVATPWHQTLVIVRDDHDLRYLRNELAGTGHLAVRSAA
jgi:hypothetical protein